MPDKAEALADLLDLINMYKQEGYEKEAAHLLKKYQSFVNSMRELDRVKNVEE